MPQLPFAGTTADVRIGRPGGGAPRPSGPPGAGPQIAAARAQAQFGGEVQRLGSVILQITQDRDIRNVQVESVKANAAFAQELEDAVQTGKDFEEVAQRGLDRLDQIGQNTGTGAGAAAYELQRAKAEAMYADAVQRAEVKRTALEVREQSTTMVNTLGATVTAAPESLPGAIAEMESFLDTFSNMRPEQRALIQQEANNDLSVAAADSGLRSDPLALKEAMLAGAFEHINPAQRSAYINRADAALARGKEGAGAKDEMGKLLLRQALAKESEDHVLTNAEAPEWFDRGVTASQFDAAQKRSLDLENARLELAKNIGIITSGGGAALGQEDYETALEKLTSDATEGMPPEEAAAAAVNMRTEFAVFNGRQDSQLKAILNAGPTAGEATFSSGLAIRETLRDQSPELLARMENGQTTAWYNAYEFMTERMGLDPDTARAQLFETSENLKKTTDAFNSKENRELIEDAVDVEFEGQQAMVQEQIKDRAAFYMALVPTMTAEQAVEQSATDFENSTVELPNGIRAKVGGVPVRWEPADQYVRNVALERDLKAAGITTDTDERAAMTFFPNGDGTVTVIGSNNLTIFPRWDWQGAVDEWWLELGQADIAVEAKRKLEAKRKERAVAGSIPAETGLLGF